MKFKLTVVHKIGLALLGLIALGYLYFLYNLFSGDPTVLPITIINNYHLPVYDITLDPNGYKHEPITIEIIEPGNTHEFEFNNGNMVNSLKFSSRVHENPINWDSGYLGGESLSLRIIFTITERGNLDVQYTRMPFTIARRITPYRPTRELKFLI
jgi:hypothetical protein